ncbi:3-oxoacyl-ACP synthase [Kitasatospora sp. MMS16-BH015]|uniref:beta-ketoacyl-ACP synthase III n=1 Tax=Kitasatospora sp. MMS16-BH015 TaxID=2018025 RepID=UPI000CA134FA|nr:beta-ketoacyl-ACP synthase III [Kitasatospora sp. MMS16-BH015]AUG80439.1 3-oxoacyl-ACP synthase [Kitasatospora sp. MMS16-BH015]
MAAAPAPAALRAAPAGPAGSRILGVGAYRPARIVGNEEICTRIDSDDAWIRQRSGIATRHFAGPGETVVTMAVEAGLKALAQAGVAPAQVDLVLLASMSHLGRASAAAPEVAHLLGAGRAAATDLSAACAGFCYALGVADSMIRAGAARHVVVVGAERMTDIVDPYDRDTAFIFGDGAGAVVLGPAAVPGVGPVVWGTEGDRHGLIARDRSWPEARERPDPWPTLRMDGPQVFRWAIAKVPEIGGAALAAAGVTAADLAAFVPHQANLRIVDTSARRLGLPGHTAVARDIVRSGNTSAASVPLALDDLLARGELLSGGLALLVGFGAGLAYAAQVVALP